MDFSKMLEQAQEMQKKMADAKESLKNISVEGESGAGGVYSSSTRFPLY